jgi:hypothetical protein
MRSPDFARIASLAVLLLAWPGPAAHTEPAAGGEEIAASIIARLEGDIEALKLFSFRELSLVEHHDSGGEVRSRERELSEVFYRDGRRMRRLLSDDAAKGGAPRADDANFDLKALAACFTFSAAAGATLVGRPALRLDFAARPGCLQSQAAGRTARILGNLDGRMWVDPEGYQLLRLEGYLRSPVTFGFGLLAKIDAFDLELVREAVSPGVYAMTEMEYRARGRVFPARRFDVRSRRERSAFERLSDHRLSNSATTPSRPPA